MNITETIDKYFELEEAIGKHFGAKLYEGVEDMRDVKWSYEDGGDLRWVEDDEEYSAEIYGTSVWETEEFTLFTVFSDFGGKYQAIFKNSNKDNDLEWEY